MNEADSLLLADSLASGDTLALVPQDTIVERLIPYDDGGFVKGDSVLHADVPYRPWGFAFSPTPFRIRSEAWSALLLLLCLLLAASLMSRLKGKFKETLGGVFLPIPGKKDEPLVDDPLRYSTRLLAVALLSLAATMVTFTYTQYAVEFYAFQETPYLLFGAILLLWIVYFLLKRMMISFVNWVFFRDEKIFTMQRVYTFIYVVDAMLVLALAMAVVYLPVPHEKVLISSLCIVLFVKLLLLFKTYKIFFPKIYGTLHLIVYFCTLELIPLLVLRQVLTYADYLSVIKI